MADPIPTYLVRMLVLPSVNLSAGAAVQLAGGSYTHEVVRLDDPVGQLRRWGHHAFAAVHLLDLDAATGRGDNHTLIQEMLHSADIPIRVGGGVRDLVRIERLLDLGAAEVVVGTRAVEDTHWAATAAEEFPQRVVVAIDVRRRTVVTHGFSRTLHRPLERVLEDLAELPLAGIMTTAVHCSGRAAGTDVGLAELAVECADGLPITAAGGVASLGELRALEDRGVAASVVGVALYTDLLDPARIAAEFGSADESSTPTFVRARS